MPDLEILLLVFVLVAVLGVARLVRAVSPFIVNAVVGLVVLLLAELVFGIGVALSPIVVAIVAIGGIPGSLLVVGLSLFGVGFVP